MITLVRLFGIAIVVMGVIFLVNPDILKQYISFWKNKKRIQAGAIAAILCGMIFLRAASQCRLAWLITVFGIWSIIKGVLLLTIGQKKISAYMDWWNNKPASVARYLGIFAIAVGVLMIYSA